MSNLRASSLCIVLSAVACADPGSSPAAASFSASTVENRIVGGAAFAGLPAVGAVTYQGQMWCTGTLISARKVVTAAHCLSDVSPSSLGFTIGTSVDAPEKTYAISGGAQYPGWNESTLSGDIAYLTLAQDATETPVKLLNNLDSSWVGVELTFVGYGVDDGQRQSGSGVKRAVIMPISEVGSTQFAYQTAGKNTCNGDSGGPAFFVDQGGNYLLAGTTSYGDTYCTQYGVDTTVPAYLSWLGATGTAPSATTTTTADDDDTTTTTTTDPCGGETYIGRCSGDTVVWCENSTVYEVDCSRRNKTCVYSDYDGYYGCAVKTQTTTTDPCKGETYQGRCSGSTVIWCENGTVQSLACGDYGGTCDYDTSRGISNCFY